MKPSSLTLASHGCLLTSLSMYLHNFSPVYHMNPGELLDRLIASNGLMSTGDFSWPQFAQVFPEFKFFKRVDTTNTGTKNQWYVETPEKAIITIKKLISMGHPVPVWVDALNKDRAADHWVLVAGVEGDDFIIHDPARGDRILFSTHYGSLQSGIYGYGVIIGTPINFPDTSSEVEKSAGIMLGQLAKIEKMTFQHPANQLAKEVLENMAG